METGLSRLIQVVAEDLADVDLARAQAREARRGLRNAADDEFLEGGRLPPVIRYRLEPVVVALLALDVAKRTRTDRVERGLVLADRLDVLLRGGVLVADELGEVRRHLPRAVLEVHDDRELVGRLDPVELAAEERG